MLVKKGRFPEHLVGLYLDDGLAVVEVQRSNLTAVENLKKQLHKDIGDLGLRVTFDKVQMGVEYLDIRMDLVTNTYSPYMKPSDNPLYVDTRSNHPPSVFKAVPRGVARRIATNSSSEEIFKAAQTPYLTSLRTAHYPEGDIREAWNYGTKDIPPKNRKRKGRNFTYFLAPYNASVATNVIGYVRNLIQTSFPKDSKLQSAFNSTNVRYSYCVAQSMGHLIKAHNNKLLGGQAGDPVGEGACNRTCKEAKGGDQCWAGGHCNARNVVYGVKVNAYQGGNKDQGGTQVPFKGHPYRFYAGHTLDLKQRKYQHTTSFNPAKKDVVKGGKTVKTMAQLNADKRTRSTFAGHIWDLRDAGLTHELEWTILHRARPYRPWDKFCSLCTSEATVIAFGDPTFLNKRSEVRTKCIHMTKYKLDKYHRPPPQPPPNAPLPRPP